MGVGCGWLREPVAGRVGRWLGVRGDGWACGSVAGAAGWRLGPR